MRKVRILTDSCSDMPRELREKYDVDYVRMKTSYNGEEKWANLDFAEYTPRHLYDIMRGGERVLTTQVPPDEFEQVFRRLLDEGYDIVYIGCSLKQSSSVNTGAVVARKLLEEYPDARIFCIDSLNACMGETVLAVRAAMYRDEGLDAQAINDRIMAERNNVREYVAVHTLDALKRAGRIKASKAFFGNLLGVKPIITSDVNGDQVPVKKVKGRQASLAELVSLTKESIVDPENQTIYIAHADCAEEAEEVKKMILAEIPCRDVVVGYIGPIIGASIGPDAIAVFSYGKEVTFAG